MCYLKELIYLLYMHVHRDWTKVYKSDDSEVFNRGGCKDVRGEVYEIPFDGSSFLTLKVHMQHERSYARSEFVILEQGKSLYSGEFSIKLLF